MYGLDGKLVHVTLVRISYSKYLIDEHFDHPYWHQWDDVHQQTSTVLNPVFTEIGQVFEYPTQIFWFSLSMPRGFNSGNDIVSWSFI